jgi:hypothetical protein
MVESKCVYKFQFQKPKERDNLRDLNIVGITVAKWILKEIGRGKNVD